MRENCNTSLVLRKGAWTAEEDMLLKKCIEKFGEGKWHLVPLRAGLNRCRKSCRLRWTNYLRPNIKRGDFDEDEVDLILRLHKLLGNRWSLIAGRIPGRTANDVKNYWNTHVRPRHKQQKEDQLEVGEPSEHTMVTVFKPQPRAISKTFNLSPHITTHYTSNLTTLSNDGIDNALKITPGLVSSPSVSNGKNINAYLDELFDDQEKELDEIELDEIGWSFGGFSEVGEGLDVMEQEDGQNSLFDFPIEEVDMWDILDSNQL
ncbi:hypothetical protein L1987_71536 [Smallanthus sonchifolius]|uniref:Uncharacterized protein n=1 Tax=Smallanthus sonchifolius TaxID=185202 RepID=A0ACB9ATC5_9ASTR|nr:hypothetical protein L1987_71536 [Smallanthus sonchifolius]